MTSHFDLIRLSDDLVYHFTRKTRSGGQSGYKRSDADHWIIFMPGLGWIAWDFPSQLVMGRPWDVLPEQQGKDAPPEGIWVSRKGPKSYVYKLVYVAGSDAY